MLDALRGVIARVMQEAAARGRLIGEHHFYIAFLTGQPGVGVSPALRAQYPEAMKIVLQHVFDDLEADEHGFSVTLRFGGVPERLNVPYRAIVEFSDPSVGLTLRFPPSEPEPETKLPAEVKPQTSTSGNVVTVDFGKKK